MKICADCRKEIADDAIFCSYCGTVIDPEVKSKEKWFFKMPSLVVSFLCVGPFMLPLVWLHPTLSKKEKVVYTIIILILSYFIFVIFTKSMKSLLNSYKLAGMM